MTVPTTAPVQTPAPTEVSANTNDENQNAPENQNPDGSHKPFKAPDKSYHRIKSGDKEEELPIDEVVRRASLYTGSERRLAEATKKEKEITGLLKRLETADSLTDEDLKIFGSSDRARTLLEKFVWDKMKAEEEEQKLTPDQRQVRDEKKRADAAEKQLKDLEEASKNRDREAQTEAAGEIINREVNDAIAEAEKAGLSPQDVPRYLEELFENMILHLEYLEDCEKEGIAPTKSPLSPRDVLRKIQDTHSDRSKSWLQKLSPKDLRALLSDEQLDGLRKSDVEALIQPSTRNRATAPKPSAATESVNPFAEPKAKKKPNSNEWFAAADDYYAKRRGR